jgi:predicted AAA+ superfamily ATPase
MQFNRKIESRIQKRLGSGKAIIVLGARQVGKSTLVKKLLDGKDYVFLNGDSPTVKENMTGATPDRLRSILGKKKILFVDEAQRIPDIGLSLKIILDTMPGIDLIVSGSSALDLSTRINEPLTGRKWEYNLYPISWAELEDNIGMIAALESLESRLVYGMYPEVIKNTGDERETLNNLFDSYLFKDIITLSDLRKPELLQDLVRALAAQIGSEVSYNELSRTLGVDKNTVKKYIEVLEKGFVVFKLRQFSRNARNEIKSQRKIYFYDVGIRNAAIGDFSQFSGRLDKGAIWENFLIAERWKYNSNNLTYAKPHFWRTRTQQELDYVETSDGQISAFEFKLKGKDRYKTPSAFLDKYGVEARVIDMKNFRDFLIR